MTDDRIIPLLKAGPARSDTPPVFERIGIVGLGLIGGSIALAARQVWPTSLVIGVDRDEVLEPAIARHAIDVAASDLTIVSEADLVILAAPVRQNIALLAQLPDYIDKPVVVTDVGSTKRAMVAAAGALPPRMTFVGGHPLAGSAQSGIDAARPDLFAGRPWLFTPPDDAAVPRPEDPTNPPAAGSVEDRGEVGGALARLFSFVTALGAVPHALDAAHHDRLVAFISHLPQLSVSALMQVVGEAVGEEGLRLSGRGLLDTTRLAGSPADIWTDICATNGTEIRAALALLIDSLTALRDRLDDDAVRRVIGGGNRWRALLADKRP